MRYGFVARQVQASGQVLRGLNDLFFHAKILARRQSSSRPANSRQI
jgi:hypothetical protein